MENRDQYHGSLVAFEGPADAVSTQLRLLPTSPQVLLLPGIQSYMKIGDDVPFSARALVRNAHEAAQTRHDVAMNFLRGSTAKNERIVFLSGGTAGAVSQCISTISEHQAPGDYLEAESIFRNIAQGGVKGLDQQGKYSDPKTLQILNREDDWEEPSWGNDEIEDPITRAMRAADALYEETDSLQPIDYFTRTRPRPRSFSLPSYGHADGMGEPSPFFVAGSSPNEETPLDSRPDNDEPPNFQRTVEEDLSNIHSTRKRHGISREYLGLDRPSSCMGEPYEHNTAEHRSQLGPPPMDVVPSPPPTPDGVVYGEARLVQMRASRTNNQLRNTRSLDDLELHQTVQRRDSSVSTSQAPKSTAPLDATEAKSRHLSIVEDPYSSNNLLHLPHAKFVKAHTTTIRRSPIFHKQPPKPSKEGYVHRGTDAADFDDDEQHALGEPFQPVLPLTEDFVIRFTDETYDPILESVIQSFKKGKFPVSAFSHASMHTGRTDSCPSTAMTTDSGLPYDQVWLPRVAEHPSVWDSEEYDPFAARGHDVRLSNLALQTPSPPPSAVSMYTRQLPTPSQTPPPVPNSMESRFHDFSTRDRPNAIVIQNALRSVLGACFPPQQYGGFHQSSRSLPDMDSLWSPIFREKEVHGSKMTRMKMDLILAIGSQKGVKGDFLPALTGQIEKLGSKSSGLSRSGRLDIRYLVANAMQSFTAQPLAQQIHNNPFESPYLLACLIIPHLETYLAAHLRVRFLLLEYPPDHLATVLALQKLLGTNMLKVAGIIDSEATSPPPSVSSPGHSRQSSRSCTLSNNPDNDSLNSINLGGPLFLDNKSNLAHRRTYSFSKANYLLTCSATEPEIALFISTIWKLLIEADSFYVPERSLSHVSRTGTARSIKGNSAAASPLPKLLRKSTLQGRDETSPVYTHTPSILPQQHVKDGGEGGSRSTPRITTSTAALAREFPFAPPVPPPPPPPPRSVSPTPSVTSTRPRGRGVPSYTPGQRPRSRSATRRPLARAAEDKNDGASLYAISVVEDGEFYDEEERRLMPMYMRQKELRKGNSRKALKWLGLA